MANVLFKIRGIDSGDLLDITQNGNAEVNSKAAEREIRWKLKTDEVCGFRIESKSGDNPFETAIPTDFRPIVDLKVKPRDEDLEWRYSIVWIDTKDGSIHRHDPKIAIKSSKNTPFDHEYNWPWQRWLGVGLGLLGLALWLTAGKDKHKR